MDLKFKKYFTLNGDICSLYLLSPSHGISKIFKYIYEEINHSPCTQLFSMEKYVNYKNQVESKPIINVVIHEDEPTLATVIQFLTNLLISIIYTFFNTKIGSQLWNAQVVKMVRCVLEYLEGQKSCSMALVPCHICLLV